MDTDQLPSFDSLRSSASERRSDSQAVQFSVPLESSLRPEEERLLEWVNQLEDREPFSLTVGSKESVGEESWGDWKNELRRRSAHVALPGLLQLEETARSAIVSSCSRAGKKVRFKSLSPEDAQQICIDPSTHEILRSALVHLVRNAVTHGIETPVERQALGKTKEGVISLKLSWEQGALSLEVSDDGRGLQEDRIRLQARKMGLPIADHLELSELIFHPQVSSRDSDERDEWAGTAVGLDAVRTSLREQEGDIIAVPHAPGEGTTFKIRLKPSRLGLNVVRVQLKSDQSARTFYLAESAYRERRSELLSAGLSAVLSEVLTNSRRSCFSFERFIRGPLGVAQFDEMSWLQSLGAEPIWTVSTQGESEFRLFQRADDSWAAKIPKGSAGYGFQLGLAPLLEA